MIGLPLLEGAPFSFLALQQALLQAQLIVHLDYDCISLVYQGVLLFPCPHHTLTGYLPLEATNLTVYDYMTICYFFPGCMYRHLIHLFRFPSSDSKPPLSRTFLGFVLLIHPALFFPF